MIHGKQIRNASISLAKLLADIDLGMNGYKIAGLGTPTDAADAATKLYVDSVAQSLIIKDAVRVATTAVSELENVGGLAYTYNDGDSPTNADSWTGVTNPKPIDGISIEDGDRILIKDAANKKGNGIWVYDDATNKFNRAPDANNVGSTSEVKVGMFTFVQYGTVNENTGYVLTAQPGSLPSPLSPTGVYDLGYDTLYFTQFTGAGTITAGPGLTKTGNELSVNVDDSTIAISTNTLMIKDGGVSTIKLADSAVETVKINNLAVTTAKINANAVTLAKLNSDIVDTAGPVALGVSGLTLTIDSNIFEFNTATLTIKNGGVGATQIADSAIETDKIANLTVTAAKIADLTITGDKIANNTITPDKLDIDSFLAPDGGLIDRAGTPGGFAINVDDTTVEINASNQLIVKAGGIGTTQLADSAVSTVKIADGAITTDKLNANIIVTDGVLSIETSGTEAEKGLKVNFDDTTITSIASTLVVKNGGIGTTQLADGGVTLAKLDIGNILDSITGNGLETSGSPATSLNVKPDTTVPATVSVSGNGIKTAVIYKNPAAASATASTDNTTTGIALTETPAGNSSILVYINGILEELGANAVSSALYFSADSGSTAKALNAAVLGDTLYVNPTVLGYNLTAEDKISLVYSKII